MFADATDSDGGNNSKEGDHAHCCHYQSAYNPSASPVSRLPEQCFGARIDF
jgi:hypothetical protein